MRHSFRDAGAMTRLRMMTCGTQWARSRLGPGALALGTALVLGGCGDGASAPPVTPGDLTVVLESPNGAEGAVLVEIDGFVSASAPAAGELYTVEDGEMTRVLVILDEAGEIRFQITVPDVREDPEYRIIEVSGPDDSVRQLLDGYTLEFTP